MKLLFVKAPGKKSLHSQALGLSDNPVRLFPETHYSDASCRTQSGATRGSIAPFQPNCLPTSIGLFAGRCKSPGSSLFLDILLFNVPAGARSDVWEKVVPGYRVVSGSSGMFHYAICKDSSTRNAAITLEQIQAPCRCRGA